MEKINERKILNEYLINIRSYLNGNTTIENIHKREGWMGIGITHSISLPIDQIAFIERPSKMLKKYSIIIADDLSTYNGMDLEEARTAGDKIRTILDSMIDLLNLKNVDIIKWREISEREEYQKILSTLKEIRHHKDLKNDIYAAMPMRDYNGNKIKKWKDRYEYNRMCNNDRNKKSNKKSGNRAWETDVREVVNKADYILEESAITLLLNEKVKIGHQGEIRYDRVSESILKVLQNNGNLADIEKLDMLILNGGFTLDGKQVAPYCTWKSKEMILLNDSLEVIERKLRSASGEYEDWCRRLIKITGNGPTENLAQDIYHNIIEPLGVNL